MVRIIKCFIVLWIVLIVISFFTASDSISVFARFGFTAVMAIIGSVLFSGKTADKKSFKSSGPVDYKNCDIYYPADSKVLYRIRNGKIYKELDVIPTYEIKGKEIYPMLDPKPIYRIEGNKVYRKLEVVPVFEIKGNKVYLPLSSKVLYEIK